MRHRIVLEENEFGWNHKTVAGWLFDEWGFPDSLRDAVTDEGSPEDGTAAYPVVRVVASLSAPGEPPELMEATAARITGVFGLPADEAAEILQAARSDAATLAGSLR